MRGHCKAETFPSPAAGAEKSLTQWREVKPEVAKKPSPAAPPVLSLHLCVNLRLRSSAYLRSAAISSLSFCRSVSMSGSLMGESSVATPLLLALRLAALECQDPHGNNREEVADDAAITMESSA